ncbi:V8-like Glu-specific endopeptidase [Streptacidiphilus sp. MAP12-16]|uniref:trypsin-like serine peptidase n=1 Tax=Streptacidiphilus sp. MAP12-16 TaxID=3156300 RepID=UPI003512EF29
MPKGPRTTRTVLRGVGAALTCAVVPFCIDTVPHLPSASASPSHSAASTRQVRAVATRPAAAHTPTTRAGSAEQVPPPSFPAAFRVGAVFSPAGSWHHYCTASVVDSPHRNLLITAAHCVHYGSGSGYRSGIAFSPGDGSGHGPAGTWRVSAELVDPAWSSASDPDVDVAFVVVSPLAGRNIEDVVGGNPLGIGRRPGHIGLIGYPDDSDSSHACTGTVRQRSASQNRVYCPGFTSGTSGSPWLAGPHAASGSGTIVGVIGGYHRGGSTPDVSYSSAFDDRVAALYRRAVTL